MDRIWNETMDEVALLVMLGILVVLVLYGFIFLAILWFLISGAVAARRYKQYLQRGAAEYQAVEDEVGAGYDADEVLSAVYGAGIEFSDGGWDNAMDFLDDTVFGMSTDYETTQTNYR